MNRLLRTNAFRLAALYLLLFVASVLALLAFIYFSTAGFIERQTEATIDAEITGLREEYTERGLAGLLDIIHTRSTAPAPHGDSTLYLVTDPALQPLAGNLSAWPRAEQIRPGWIRFPVEVRTRGHGHELGHRLGLRAA